MISIRKNTFFQILCYLFVLCVPLTWASFLGGSAYRLITIALAGAFALAALTQKGTVLRRKGQLIAWTIYVAYVVMMFPFARRTSNAIITAIGLVLVYVVVVIYSATEWTSEDRRKMDNMWILVGVLCVLGYLLGSRAQVGEYGDRMSIVVFGTATDPNEFAGVFIVPVSLCMYRAFTEGKLWQRMGYLVLVIAQIVAVFMSGSRGALLGVVLAMLATFFVLPKKNAKMILTIVAFSALGILIVWKFLLPLVPESVLQRFSIEALQESGGSNRSSIWKAGLEEFFRGSAWQLLFGYGPHGLNVARTTMHNQFLQVLVDYGIVGAGLFLFLLGTVLRAFYKNNKVYLGAYLGMLLLSMTLTMPASYKPLWVLMIMPMVVAEEADKGKIQVKKTADKVIQQ